MLGEPVFLEDFGLPDMVFFIFEDGAEGELGLGRQSHFDHLHAGPYTVLVDKAGILEGKILPGRAPAQSEQVETLRRTVFWFWHDLSHFITALGRGQLWWAQGQLDVLRACCVILARLQHDFSYSLDVAEPYFKIEQALPVERLAPLLATFCPQEPDAMLQAALAILQFYRKLALALAQEYAIKYPAGLDRLMSDRLEKLRRRDSS